MSHLELIRAAYDAANRQDYEALLPLIHPDAEARPILGANLQADIYRGHEGVKQWLEDLNCDWEVFDSDPVEIVERGERVLCRIQVRALGRASGVAIEAEIFHVCTMLDGQIIRLEGFTDREAAVHALEAT
jgi:ketosteroid isomerase-like protein